MLKKLNWNSIVKVKLNDRGKDIYYHRLDDLLKEYPRLPLEPSYPEVDENGYSKFQLWDFMQLYGPHIGMGFPNVADDISFYISNEDLKDFDQGERNEC